MAGTALEQEAGAESLIERARRNDRAAIRAIIKQQNRRLYRIARSIVGDDSEAEDVLQEAYIRAFRDLAAFRGEAQFGTWIARIVINEALGLLRRRKPVVMLGEAGESAAREAEIIPFPNANPDPETAMAQREIVALLERAIDRLPEPFRAVLVARLVEGLSVEETAELFDILPQTVKTRLYRARELLKRAMEAETGPALTEAFPFAGRRCDAFTETMLARLGDSPP
jgi:RNA polymerase sigma-70 factor (ECF subfamily)